MRSSPFTFTGQVPVVEQDRAHFRRQHGFQRLGGGWSLSAAQLLPDELDASVIYYGQVTADEDKLRPVTTPILGLFAAEDTGITVESVEAFRAALERLRKEHEIHIYPGVGHAFANPTGRNYNAEAAEDAWARTLEFLAHHLVAGASEGA